MKRLEAAPPKVEAPQTIAERALAAAREATTPKAVATPEVKPTPTPTPTPQRVTPPTPPETPVEPKLETAPVKGRPEKTKVRRGPSLIERRRQIYQPGNVVYNSHWRSHDRVLDYREEPNGAFAVLVQASDAEGNPIPREQPRWHSTEPRVGDRVVKAGVPLPEGTPPTVRSTLEQAKPVVRVERYKTDTPRVYELRYEGEPIGMVKAYPLGWRDVEGGPFHKTIQEAATELLGEVAKGADVKVVVPSKPATDVVPPTPTAPTPKPGPAKPLGKLITELMAKPTRTPQEEAQLAALQRAALARRRETQKGAVDPEIFSKFIERLRAAVPRRAEQEKLYSAERGQRVAAMTGVTTPGVAGLHERLGLLKGELPKVKPPGAIETPQAVLDELVDAAVTHPDLTPYEQVRAGIAVMKIFSGEEVPQENELLLLRKVFNQDAAKLFREMPKSKKWQDYVKEAALEIPASMRTMMASYDVSAPFRQGIFMIGRKEFWKAIPEMYKMTWSEKTFDAIQDRITSHPDFDLAIKSGLDLTELFGETMARREERFAGQYPEKIPIIGAGVRASARAYTGFLNKLRADVFYNLIEDVRGMGGNVEEIAPRLAWYINAATGRGKLPQSLRGAAPVMNALLFSPRLMASRLTLLNPYTYINPKTPAFVRKQAVADLLRFSGAMLTILGLAKMAGAEVGTKSTSADFGKIKIGNTRVDVAGGFQQYLRLGAQLLEGEYTSTTTGRTFKLGGERVGGKRLTRLDLLSRFIESKEAPFMSLVTDILRGTTMEGKKVNIPIEVLKRYVPMVLSDTIDIAKDDPRLLPLVVPGMHGVGLQTYGGQKIPPLIVHQPPATTKVPRVRRPE
jgi:hypothetical protein